MFKQVLEESLKPINDRLERMINQVDRISDRLNQINGTLRIKADVEYTQEEFGSLVFQALFDFGIECGVTTGTRHVFGMFSDELDNQVIWHPWECKMISVGNGRYKMYDEAETLSSKIKQIALQVSQLCPNRKADLYFTDIGRVDNEGDDDTVYGCVSIKI